MLICSSCGTVVEDSALIHRKYFNRASVATSRHQNIANVPLRLRSEPNAVHKETRERKAATSAEARSQKRARAHAAELEAEAGRAARDRERAAEEEKALASRRRELAAWQEERFRAKAMAARQLVAAQVSANAAQAAKVAAVAAERAKAEAAAAEVSPKWTARKAVMLEQELQRKAAALRQKALFREARLRQTLPEAMPSAPSASGGPVDLCPDNMSVEALAQHVLTQVECPWRRLLLKPHAMPDAVRKRYRLLALRLHPDKTDYSQAPQAFAAVESAYQRIK